MLTDKWKPLYAPDVETGAGEPAAPAEPPVPMNERPVDGPGSGRSVLRQQLEKNVDTVRKAETQRKPPQRSRARQEMEAAAQEPAQGQQPAQEPAQGQEPAQEPAQGQEPATELKAPEGWTKEAKAEWENLPPQVQAAVAKREVDMANGVNEIKKKYADIDGALQPRLDVIRRHGHTPAEAVNQLFAWFEAISANPQVAFPALAQSFKFDIRTIPGLAQAMQQYQQSAQQQPAQGQQQQPAQGQPGQPPVDMPPAVQQYINSLKQELQEFKQGVGQNFQQLTNSFAQQSQAKTEEILMNWAKDKPYFEDVRRHMAHLISSGAVPPMANGNADLDKAYDMAIFAIPDVRTKILADQQKAADNARTAKAAAERAAQQEQANKARRASGGSLTPGAPGNLIAPGKPKKGKSVRESIMEAREELSE